MDIEQYMPKSVQNKSVIITGGTSGIGLSAAIMLAAAGARIMVVGNNKNKLEKALSQIKQKATAGVFGLSADVSEEKDIEKIFSFADEHLGDIDIFINNAAIGYGPLTNGTYSELDNVVKINFTAYLACVREAVLRMKQKGSGHIIAIGSMSADGREEGGSVYVAAKAGIQAFCESLRKEVNKEGIKVTLIEPGAVDTDMQEEEKEEKDRKIGNMEMLIANDVAGSILYCLMQPQRCDIVQLKVKPHRQYI